MKKDNGFAPRKCFCKKNLIQKTVDFFTAKGCRWETISVNGYHIPCEAKCMKDQYAHRILKASDLPEVAEWKEGKHPN